MIVHFNEGKENRVSGEFDEFDISGCIVGTVRNIMVSKAKI